MAQTTANGICIEYESHGPADGEAVLLFMGLGGQLNLWPEGLISHLAANGHRVITFDYRDVGLSQKMTGAGPANIDAVRQRLAKGEKPGVAYTLEDLAADAVGLLDALAISRAHLAGISFGGMVAQLVAADYPDRVLSLTSIMSTTGNRSLPPPTPEAIAVLGKSPEPEDDIESYLAHHLRAARVIGSPAYPSEDSYIRERSLRAVRRGYYAEGYWRQYAASMVAQDRRPKLAKIKAPTVVIHGQDDPLVPLACGKDTADNIPGAELRVIRGMGHDLPVPLLKDVAAGILRAVERATSVAA